MAEEDLKALIAYLKTLKPVKKATPELESRASLTRSLGIPTYLKIFGRFSNSPAQAPKSGNRARAVSSWACFSLWRLSYAEKFHRSANRSLYLAGAGAKTSPLGEDVPNITPDRETGIGDWKREDIAELFANGD